MLTSIDMEGTKKGFDIELNDLVSKTCSIPIISSGGAGSNNHIIELIEKTNVDAIAIASMFHYEISSVENVKKHINKS